MVPVRYLALSLGVGVFLFLEAARANPCNAPTRMVKGYTVDLQPLFDWWPRPKGARPLSAWKHVRGRIERDSALGWTIIGSVEGQHEPCTILVKNPPREKLQRFSELKRQLPEYERARAATAEFLKRPVCTDWYSYWLSPWTLPPISLSEYKSALSSLEQLGQAIQAIRQELRPMIGSEGEFNLDAFALKVNATHESLPVFDYGSPHPFQARR